MLDAAFALAAEIASKSPVAVQGTKVNLVYSRNHSVDEGLKYMVRLCPTTHGPPWIPQEINQGPAGLCLSGPLMG